MNGRDNMDDDDGTDRTYEKKTVQLIRFGVKRRRSVMHARIIIYKIYNIIHIQTNEHTVRHRIAYIQGVLVHATITLVQLIAVLYIIFSA